jgi:tetrahydromethanopterin S-methyltransferase subunit F
LPITQRTSYKDFITDPIIFDPAVMYRPNDPEFGVQTQIKMLLETGIEKAGLDVYAEVMQSYFYRKSFYFGEVKSISAQDSAGNNVYDLIYVDIIDNQMNGTYSPSYSNSVVNMQTALEEITLDSGIIQVNDRLQPKYMTTLQSDTGVAIGFVKAVILCYTIPGGSTKVLSRIANALSTGEFDFKQYHFDTDRIVVETVKDTEQTGWILNPTERR